MSETGETVRRVVPYAEFLERRERRARVAAEFSRQHALPTNETEALAVEPATTRPDRDADSRSRSDRTIVSPPA
jgi:hypothetical protein